MGIGKWRYEKQWKKDENRMDCGSLEGDLTDAAIIRTHGDTTDGEMI
jgi:hypothetical protein